MLAPRSRSPHKRCHEPEPSSTFGLLTRYAWSPGTPNAPVYTRHIVDRPGRRAHGGNPESPLYSPHGAAPVRLSTRPFSYLRIPPNPEGCCAEFRLWCGTRGRRRSIRTSIDRRHVTPEQAGRLAHLDEVAIGVTHVAADFAPAVDRRRDEGGAFRAPLPVAGLDVGDAQVEEDRSGVSRLVVHDRDPRLVGSRPPPEFMMIHELESLTMEGVPSSTTVPPRTRE